MQAIEKLKTTDDLGEHGGGIWKKWPWKDSDHYELMSDLILKAKYSIQDFNSTIGGGLLAQPKGHRLSCGTCYLDKRCVLAN